MACYIYLYIQWTMYMMFKNKMLTNFYCEQELFYALSFAENYKPVTSIKSIKHESEHL